MKRFKLTSISEILSGSALLVLLLAPGTALAHEHRTIANGKYDVTVGWDIEPTFVGVKNAASIRIMDAGTSNPVTGAEKGLKLAIRQGASTQSFPLRPFGQPGYYVADIVPTRSHLRGPWNQAYDLDALTTMEQKSHYLSLAVSDRTWVSFAHDDTVFAARVNNDRGKLVLAEKVPVPGHLRGVP